MHLDVKRSRGAKISTPELQGKVLQMMFGGIKRNSFFASQKRTIKRQKLRRSTMATKAENLRQTGYGGQEREILKGIWWRYKRGFVSR